MGRFLKEFKSKKLKITINFLQNINVNNRQLVTFLNKNKLILKIIQKKIKTLKKSNTFVQSITHIL